MNFAKNKKKRLALRLFFPAIIFFILDRFFKKMALQGKISFFPNPNLALGIPCPDFIFYPLFLVIFYFLSQNLIRFWQEKRSRDFFALSLILTGAFSNFLDRIHHFYVIDYLNFFSFSLINLADLMIVCGALIFIFSFLKKA